MLKKFSKIKIFRKNKIRTKKTKKKKFKRIIFQLIIKKILKLFKNFQKMLRIIFQILNINKKYLKFCNSCLKIWIKSKNKKKQMIFIVKKVVIRFKKIMLIQVIKKV